MDKPTIFNKLKAIFSTSTAAPGPLPAAPSNNHAMTLPSGGFEGAGYSRDRSFLYTTDANELASKDLYSRQRLVTVARYLVNNYPLFERILSVAEIYGVGAGIIANATTGDDNYNAAATDFFNQWADSQFCSNNQRYNFYEAQKLVIRELLIAGEIFIVLINAPSGYPQIMLVATENVRRSDDAEDNSINGQYVDAYGKVVAYNIFTGKTYQKVDASQVIHLMLHKQVGQLRGNSAFASALNSARDDMDIMNLEKLAMKAQASLAVVVTKNDGRANTGLSGALLPTPVTLPNSTTPSPIVNRGLEKAFAGNVAYMQTDEKVELLSSDRSSDGFINFIEKLQRQVCLALSLPYEFLINNETQSGSGIRFTIGDAAFFFSNLQNILIDGALNRLYSWVIATAIKQGKLAAPDPAKDKLPWAVSFTKPISITIDQQRVSNIEISLVQNSMLTLEAYYSARGKNWQHEVTQRVKEEQFLNELAAETGVGIERLRTPTGRCATD